jgi:predicted metal-dependent hydrolase
VKYPFVKEKRGSPLERFITFNSPQRLMEKIERLLERYKIYLGVKDVKLVVRPYKTRTAFTNLSSSPPTIYLNEYLIDDEEVVEYLILRELIHISLHRHPPMRYTGGLSYAATAFCTSSYQRRRLKRLGKRWRKN